MACAVLTVPTARPWRPLLRGDEANRAVAAARAVADALRDPLGPAPAYGTPGQRELAALVGGDPSLASGHAGVALLFAQLHRRSRRADDREAAVAHLNRALELAAGLPVLGLASGLAGVAFAATQVARALLPGGDDPVAAVDEVIADAVDKDDWRGRYDLVGGLTGLGVACLERWPAPSAAVALHRVVRRLEDLAEHRDGGATWRTPADRLPEHQRVRAPAGYFNTGAAHGTPAVAALLAAAHACGVGTPGTPGLAAAAVRWLLDRRTDGAAASVFPCWVPADGRPPLPARLAWCYGDAGVAAQLLSAARSAGRPDWRREALDVARRAAALPADACGVRDAGLCHGAAGLAHLFQAMHRDTGDPALARAARAWLGRTLAWRRPGTGVAGFSALSTDDDGTHARVPDRGLLGGAAGVALALLGSVSRAEPHWNRLLVVAPPSGVVGGAP